MIFMRLKDIFNPQNEEIDYDFEKSRILSENRKHLSDFTFEEEPLVSIIVLNRNGLEYLKILFEDFDYKTNYSNYELILVDNASSDDSVKYAESLDLDITIIQNNDNLSFSKANNDASDIANGEYLLFLNNDIEPTFGWLNEMMGTMVYGDNVGAVGAKLIFPYYEDPEMRKKSFSIQHYGGIFREHVCSEFDYAARHQYKYSKDIFDERFLNNRKCIIATAAVFLIRKDTFFELGKFDEDYWFGFEDVDLNLKLYRNGYDVIVASAALLLHYESVTRKKEKRQNYVALNSKWGDYLFDELFHDKIERKYFLTDKELDFLFIAGKLSKNLKMHRKLHNAAKYLKSEGYDVNILDGSNLKISRKIDVLVSAIPDYDIENIDARDNIIKVLIVTGNDFNKNKCQNYDIVINASDNSDLANSYRIANLDNLAEDLILILSSHFTKK